MYVEKRLAEPRTLCARTCRAVMRVGELQRPVQQLQGRDESGELQSPIQRLMKAGSRLGLFQQEPDEGW